MLAGLCGDLLGGEGLDGLSESRSDPESGTEWEVALHTLQKIEEPRGLP